jgi:ferredoxin
VIEDLNGNVLSTFSATDSQSFVQMAEDHDLEMPVSCCSGACFVCACKIKE